MSDELAPYGHMNILEVCRALTEARATVSTLTAALEAAKGMAAVVHAAQAADLKGDGPQADKMWAKAEAIETAVEAALASATKPGETARHMNPEERAGYRAMIAERFTPAEPARPTTPAREAFRELLAKSPDNPLPTPSAAGDEAAEAVEREGEDG